MRVKIKKAVSVDKGELAALEFGKRYCATAVRHGLNLSLLEKTQFNC